MGEALEQIKTTAQDAQSNLPTTQQCIPCAMDKKKRPEEYKVGDEVVLSIENSRTYCPYILQKIKVWWLGTFYIALEVSSIAFGLDLPPS